MGKRLNTCIFLIGWTLTGVLYVLGQIEDIPLLAEVVYPSYTNATKGTIKLQESKVLLPGDTGFGELRNLNWDKIEANAKSKKSSSSGRALIRLERGDAALRFGRDRACEVIHVRAVFDDGSEEDTSMENIDVAVRRLKGTASIKYTIYMLWTCGYLLSIATFFLKSKD